MFQHPFFKDNKNSWSMVALGLIAGLLTIWLALKALRPMTHAVCSYILESNEDKGMGREGRVVAIEAEIAKISTMTKRIETVGKINANAIVTVRSEISGRIREILFTEGGSVKKDDVIIQFEDADQQAALKQAEAELVLNKANFERSEKLHEQKIGSVKDYDKAKAELNVAEAKLEAARSGLAKTKIVSTIEGTIGLTTFCNGSYVQPNQDLVTIVDSTPVVVEFKVPEKFVHEIGVGQQADIKMETFKDRIFTANVRAIDAKVDSDSHSLSVKANISNEDGALKPGLFARVSLIIGEKGDTMSVNESAVDRDGEIEFVWVVEKGKASRRRVLTGVRENGRIEIIAGLKADQIVVTAGQIKLADGVRVKITNLTPEQLEPKKVESSKKPEEETKPAEVKPAEAKPAEVKPEEAKPVDKKDETPKEAPKP